MSAIFGDTPIPKRIAKLRRNEKGYPVPWFVAEIDGKPDFRVIGEGKISQAVRHRLCFVCGEPMGKWMAFVIGPMCAVNRTSAEPPNHRDCAEFSAKVCPFLANPSRLRREGNLPASTSVAGIMLDRNPGVTLVWITDSYTPFKVPPRDAVGGVLFEIGDPSETLWFAEGRAATREEVKRSMDTGLPSLREMAVAEGPHAVLELDRRVELSLDYLP